jgi:hypothetical protein
VERKKHYVYGIRKWKIKELLHLFFKKLPKIILIIFLTICALGVIALIGGLATEILQ